MAWGESMESIYSILILLGSTVEHSNMLRPSNHCVSNRWVNSFLATKCSKNRKTKTQKHLSKVGEEEVGAADTERQDLRKISLSELRQSVRNGEFLEVQWSNSVALALLHPELMD